MPIAYFNFEKIRKEWRDLTLDGEITIQGPLVALRGIQVNSLVAEKILSTGMWSRRVRKSELPNFSVPEHIESLNGVSGYVSATTDPSVAKLFTREEGVVFVLLPEMALKVTGNSIVNALKEDEYMIPHGVSPDRVLAYRCCKYGKFTGPIHINKSINPELSMVAQRLLTNNHQDPAPCVFPIGHTPIAPPSLFFQQTQQATWTDENVSRSTLESGWQT
ncbi:hypothetical protein Psal006b_00944 [Piscirickettsia salmonis]|uniref:Uncharacterized protein n=1 Tax=Piscirickettsia salmonis TaxID=1238 RepID=A0A1L6TDF7_PISSA|nr:hypothetical protein [Piscirickettsia salmonis]AKP74471.1 hypothetical protein PSLF89_2925 [Piscirickettsia salmonis LF-89 = ATCC VR-1361]ALB23439.1 hypothetical protein KU39_2259 [Piscirickettsia salmonis]ALY03318.1 hypothetical protein AWE47_11075 [Piscirickettsia salmonis]AMA42884.1 hypothetical protein AWJ11_11305 [Piscirickettsia salmonis]AOS35352.1 hypothetical protein AVM72_08430 [Piscirickettsia salmonis]